MTVDPLEDLTNGFLYAVDIQAQSTVQEQYSDTGQQFWVLSDTSPGAISDLSVNWDDTVVVNGLSTAITDFDTLVDSGASRDASVVLQWTLPSNYSQISVHVKNDDPESTLRHFDLTSDFPFQVVEPSNYAGDTCALTAPCDPTIGGNGGILDTTTDTTDTTTALVNEYTIQSENVVSGTTTAKIVIANLDTLGYFSNLVFDGDTRTISVIVRACNTDQVGATLPDNSDDCTVSNVVNLTYTQ